MPISEEHANKIRTRWAAVTEADLADAEAKLYKEQEAERAEYEYDREAEIRADPARLAPHELTIAEITNYFGIPAHTIRKWVQRGYLTAYGTSGRANTYRRVDLVAAKQAVTERTRAAKALYVQRDDTYVDNLIDSTKAAQLLHVSPATLRVWVNRGRIAPARRKGRKNLFRTSDVIAASKRSRLP